MSNAVKIEAGIPLPRGGQGGHNRVYPWEELEPGQSFLTPRREGEDHDTARRRVYASARDAGARLGRVFKVRVRRAEKHGEEGIRVWRAQ